MDGERRHGMRVLLTAAAAAAAVSLAFCASYAYARYATEYGVTAPVALFDVTSSIIYEDAWGNAQDFSGALGAMMPKEDDGDRTMDFTFTLENHSDVPVYCTLTLGGDYDCTFEYKEGETYSYIVSEDLKTLTTGVLAAGASGSISFTVYVGTYTGSATDVDVYSGLLDITVTYIQAGEA